MTKTTKILLLILVVSFVFRFFKLSELFYFSLDEEVISFYVRQITTGEHFPAIGVNAADTGLYLGPGYLYLAAPFFVLFQNNPLGGAVMSSLIGVLATLTVYWAGLVILGKRVGLIAAFLHATSLTIALFERKFFNPQPAVLLGSFVLGLTHLSSKGNKKALYLLAMGIGTIFHLNLLLTPYILITLVWLLISKPKFSKVTWFTAIVIVLAMLSPLFFFDARHNFQLTEASIKLFTTKTSMERHFEPIKRLIVLPGFMAKVFIQNPASTNIASESVTCIAAQKNSFHLFGLALLAVGFLGLVTRKHQKQYGLVYISLFVSSLSLVFYPGIFREYYAYVMVPSLLLTISIGLSAISRYRESYYPFLLSLLFVLMINFFQLIQAENPHGLAHMEQLLESKIQQLSQPLRLDRSGDTCYGYGFDYLLTQNNKPTSKSFTDPIIGWMRYSQGYIPPIQLNSKIDVRVTPETLDLVISKDQP